MALLIAQYRRFLHICVCVLAITLNSCVYLVVGGVGAVGGYAISPDTVEGLISDTSPSEVWRTAADVVAVMGIIEERNEAMGIMLCKIQGAKVTITVTRVSENSVKLSVKSRKTFFPKIKLSEEVYLKIHKSLTG